MNRPDKSQPDLIVRAAPAVFSSSSLVAVDPSASLRRYMRVSPVVTGEESISALLSNTRGLLRPAYPVTRHGVLLGVVHLEDLREILGYTDADAREAALQRPVSAIMRSAVEQVRPDATPSAVAQQLAASGTDLVPVVDDDGYCLGVILARDLLAGASIRPRPASIGGMATPFGVYLTDGISQAGAGNGALVATGVVMCGMLLLARAILATAILAGQRLFHLPPSPVYEPGFQADADQPLLGIASVAMDLATLLVFMLLMRATRLAAFHAAEHQAVHAVERDEPLAPAVVSRMPRVHPRCGTNILTAGALFYVLCRSLSYVPGFDPYATAPMVAALITVLSWRRAGAFMQRVFTTKPAGLRETASGISAANELLMKYATRVPARAAATRRIWCSGLAQSAAGWLVAAGVIWLAGTAYTTWVK